MTMTAVASGGGTDGGAGSRSWLTLPRSALSWLVPSARSRTS